MISWPRSPAITMCWSAWIATALALVPMPPNTTPLGPNEQSNPLGVSLRQEPASDCACVWGVGVLGPGDDGVAASIEGDHARYDTFWIGVRVWEDHVLVNPCPGDYPFVAKRVIRSAGLRVAQNQQSLPFGRSCHIFSRGEHDASISRYR